MLFEDGTQTEGFIELCKWYSKVINGKSTQELAKTLNTSQSIVCQHFENIRKLGVWVPHAFSKKEKKNADHWWTKMEIIYGSIEKKKKLDIKCRGGGMGQHYIVNK